MEQLVAGAFSDGVRTGQGELGIGDDGDLGLELMAHQPEADPLCLIDSLQPRQDLQDLVDQRGVPAGHQPAENDPCGGPEHAEEGSA